MTNPVSGAENSQQVAQAAQTRVQNTQRGAANKQLLNTVTISQAGNTASEAHAAIATRKSGSEADGSA
jgi:hypothetical protein